MELVNNKVVRIALSSGIIGLLTTNPRKALEERIEAKNSEGWKAIYFIPHKETNVLGFILKIVVLALTLGFWTWGAGYLILLERKAK